MKEQKDNNLKTSSMTTNNSVGKEEIEKKYDEFFGVGYWEKQYKKPIVIFAEQCLQLKPQPLSPQSAEGVDAEKILAKHSNNYKKTVEQDEKPLYYLVVNGHEAINAMTEYSQLKGKEKDRIINDYKEECDRLTGLVDFWQKKYYELNPPQQPLKLDNL